MGIVFVAFSVDDEKIKRVHQEPALIWRLYEPEEDEMYLHEIGAGKKPGFILRLLGKKPVPIPTTIPGFVFEAGERQEIDLDKSWDGINFCLKKLQRKGVPNIFEDGKPVGIVEIGYGPAMTFLNKQVKEIAQGLSEISEVEFMSQYQPEKMKKTYPNGMWARNDENLKEYLLENYSTLKQFFVATAAKGLGICIVYT